MTARLIAAGMLILLSCESGSSGTEGYVYTAIDEVNQFMVDVNKAYPLITAIESVGTSVDGRQINALVISDNPDSTEMEPRVRISAAIHGNEKITTETLIRFINYIVSGYDSDSRITALVDSRYIVIIPVINPDGYSRWDRYNTNGVDLNRNFQWAWTSAPDHGDTFFSEPESLSMKDYSTLKNFTSSITLHAGDVIVNMPFDYTTAKPLENDLVKYMGLVYTESGSFLDNPDILDITGVYNGTINGGDWYIITGSMQDWSYFYPGCLDYTVEISVDKAPSSAEDVQQVYSYNRDSLVAFIEKSGRGIYGRVTESDGTTPVAGVKITIPGGDLAVYTDDSGYYHKILKQGIYSLTFEKSGYTSQTINNISVLDSDTGTEQDLSIH